jgi:Uma2 family endonuclease
MVAVEKRVWTPEEYLAYERASQERHELINGEIRLMAGAGVNHVRIVRNIIRQLDTQLDESECEILNNDIRTKIKLKKSYTYPDLVAICGEPELEDGEFDTLLNPVLIVEVLSPATEGYDRGEKFQSYRTIDTLQEYLMIAQDRLAVELYRRQADGTWLLSEANTFESRLNLTSIDCTLTLAEIYKRVSFETRPTSLDNGMPE